MSPNSLTPLRQMCEFETEQMKELIEVSRSTSEQVQALTHAVDVLAKQYKDMTKLLLIVVCVIALGSKAVEMVRDVWGHEPVHSVVK